jgi:hypothetical protein
MSSRRLDAERTPVVISPQLRYLRTILRICEVSFIKRNSGDDAASFICCKCECAVEAQWQLQRLNPIYSQNRLCILENYNILVTLSAYASVQSSMYVVWHVRWMQATEEAIKERRLCSVAVIRATERLFVS